MNKRVIGAICTISTLFAFCSSAVVFAEGTSVSVDVSDAVLQLTVPSSASIELSPTSSTAAFGSTDVPISVATNNLTGYALIMSVPTTNLIHSTASSNVIPTLQSSAPEATFPANAWGYKVVGNDYQPVLVSNAPASWAEESPTNGTSHTLTLATKVDGTKPSGIYTNTLTFQVVANPNAPKQTIIFDGNGADGGTTNSVSVFAGETVNLPLNGFSKTGYLFNGWNEKSGNNGTGYGDGDSYTAPAITAPQNITLYAQWVQDTGQGAANIGRTLQAAYEQAYVYNPGQFQEGDNNKHGLYVPEKNPDTGEYTGNYFEATKASDYEGIPANDLRFAIQDIGLLVGDQNVCERTTVIGSGAYVLDLRDFTSYHIAKMKDGRCWLLDNLALDPTKNDVKARLSESNTNASAEAIANFLNGGNPNGNTGWSTSPVAYEGSSSVFNQPRINAASKDIIPQGTDQLASTVLAGGWKTGVYYNYCAASIGTYCYSNGGADKSGTTYDIEYDICPAGWRMPTGGYSGEYRALAAAVDGGPSPFASYASLCFEPSYTDFRTAFRAPFSGRFVNGSAQNNGRFAGIWAATYASEYYMYMLTISNRNTYSGDGVNPHSGNERDYGYPVRCIAK